MIDSKGKISVRQAMLLFIISTMSPAIRLFPQITAIMAGKAGWLAPLPAIIPLILLVFLVNSFFGKNKNVNLSDIYSDILGNIAGKIVVFLYIIWLLVLLSLYTRYYSERLLSSIMPDTSQVFLLISLLALVFIAARKGLVIIARANEVFFPLIIFTFLLAFLFSISDIKYRNLMNVSYIDALPVLKSSFNIVTVWGYYLLFFFFADKIQNIEYIKKFSFRGLIILFTTTFLMMIMTIGTLGSRLASHVSLPFFMVIKNISILEALDHFESILLAIWVISDFIIISMFTLIIANMFKSLLNLSHVRTTISPIVVFAGIGALYMYGNRFELETFSSRIAVFVNIIFEYIFPLIIFGIGKLRKKI